MGMNLEIITQHAFTSFEDINLFLQKLEHRQIDFITKSKNAYNLAYSESGPPLLRMEPAVPSDTYPTLGSYWQDDYAPYFGIEGEIFSFKIYKQIFHMHHLMRWASFTDILPVFSEMRLSFFELHKYFGEKIIYYPDNGDNASTAFDFVVDNPYSTMDQVLECLLKMCGPPTPLSKIPIWPEENLYFVDDFLDLF